MVQVTFKLFWHHMVAQQLTKTLHVGLSFNLSPVLYLFFVRVRPCTYVLWDLDEAEGILCGLCWQGPGAEGRGYGSQTGGRHHFSLRDDEQKTEIRPAITHFSR